MIPEPGRIDSRRFVPVLFSSPGGGLGRAIAVALTVLLLSACASGGRSPHPNLSHVWRDFRALPAHKALAIAGDPRRSRWVTGSSGGHATRGGAEAKALSHCQQRRGASRMQAACVLYAVGDEIVWRGR